ncbi:SDR family NAD(P)-dependent oxidoreductase [Spongiactinospora sp. TRM90649]|uniref:SDR family NAD(P)-dependent oxidoreductase n=1 Tax=Spongiactinospora sp. TRM90649 TaxID=3031114 RepID=UPI0023F9BDED|nr:SDR family NAD(P)-dependent oxidoreductase [Spongiactinospora sp. TRM90649]MDF5755118.1 SDR family oxidoreductase [Spongiactinospora sp. TRM90649]
MADLSGKVAVVTGAGRGLGAAYAQDLAAAGARVVVNDVDATAAEAAAEAIGRAGGTAVAQPAAVGTAEAAQSLVDRAVSEFGRLDIMVTNAGVLRDTVLWKMSDEDFDTVVHVHLRGTFTCARAAAVRMRAQGEGGRVICVGSPTGQRGNFGQTNYAAAKAGIVGMVRTWAMELGRSGITVNAVIPVAATEMTRTVPFLREHVEALDRGERLTPFARRALALGSPADAAGVVTFLASDAAADVTGQAIGVGGDRVSLWSHPQQIVSSFADDGWSADALAETWPTAFHPHAQSLGEPIPQPVEQRA